MINDDKTFCHKALVWSAFFVLGDKATCYCLSSLRNILSPYFTLIQKIGGASLNKLLLHNIFKLNYVLNKHHKIIFLLLIPNRHNTPPTQAFKKLLNVQIVLILQL